MIFLKNPWETLKCLLQTLQYACYLPRSLAITQSNVLVYSALKFDPLLYRSHFFAGLIPGDDSRLSLLGLSSYTAAWVICTCIIRFYIQALNWYRFFNDFETLYPTAIRNFQASLRYQYWSLSQTGSSLSSGLARMQYWFRRLPPNYHKKWLLTKKTVRLWVDFWKSVIFFKNPFCGKRQSFPLVTREIR